MTTPYYNESEYIQMLDDCTDKKQVHQLNDWERNFVSSCYRATEIHVRLSSKQLDILNPLWDRVTANG